MPRKTRDDFSNTFLQMNVDFTGKGPQVSDDIQLTYQLDDYVETRWVSAGAGKFRGSTVGNAVLELECRNRRGLIIDDVNCIPTSGEAANTPLLFGAEASGATDPLTGILVVTPSLVSGGIPLGVVLSGHITTAQYNVTNPFFMKGFTPAWLKGFHLEFGQFLHIRKDTPSGKSILSVRWHELDRRGASA